ncbi:MAG TPA: hypothetical protein VID24_01890 [Candidatus Eremiobacteraceae bacterium]|jgi:hypothetical protein
MQYLTAVLIALSMLPLTPDAHPVGSVGLKAAPRIGRLDEATRGIVISSLAPGERIEVYAGERLMDARTATASRTMFRLRSALRPGTVVTVVGHLTAGGLVRSSTVVQNDYLQYHYDLGRTGWNPYETVLTTTNVAPNSFVHLFSLPVDAFVYAQPLFVAGVTIGQATHNIAIVATENDSLYAFDADTGAQLWQQTYANPGAGAVPIPYQFTNAQNIIPAVGITSTPAIDPNTGTIFFVAAIQQAGSGGYTYHQFLHAVDWTDGADILTPVDITATAMLNNGRHVVFDALSQLNRASLLLSSGSVYVSFGNHDDTKTPSTKPHGWIFQYDESTLALQSFFCTTLDVSNKYNGTIWGGGFGPDADAQGDVIFSTGDGPFDANTGGNNWGDSVMKMSPGLTVLDSFTPADQAQLAQLNHDLGAGGVMLLPDQPGALPHLAVDAGEEGTIYLLNRDSLGGFTPSGPDAVVQEMPQAIHKLVGGPAYYAGPTGTFVYYCGAGDPLRAFALDTSPQLTLASTASSACGGSGGAIPAVSSNGATPGTGIVWITTRPANRATHPVQLRAYDATDVSRQLIQLNVAFWQNLHNPPFLTPTVIDGKVFVGTSNSVEVFGLQPARRTQRRE